MEQTCKKLILRPFFHIMAVGKLSLAANSQPAGSYAESITPLPGLGPGTRAANRSGNRPTLSLEKTKI